MTVFKRFAILSTVGTYLVIFIGGLVRVSGAGLGCPDWPRCFGRWIPPTNINQLPEGIDPSRFNFTLAWIEYMNRLGGALLGVLILITALIAIKNHRRHKKILIPSIAAAFLVALLGIQGGVVIWTELAPIVVTAHMLLALLLASVLIYTVQQAHYLEHPQAGSEMVFPKSIDRWVLLVWILSLIQVLLGTQMRQALELLAERFPLLSDTAWLAKVGMVNHLHMTLGLIIVIGTWHVGRRILKETTNLTPAIKQTVLSMQVAISVQIVIGFVFMLVGMPELARVFHLWVASIFIGLLLIVYTASRRKVSIV